MSTVPPAVVSDIDEAGSLDFVNTAAVFLRLVRYRKNTLIATLCVTTLLGVAYYALAVRMYQSTAKLLILQQNKDQLSTVGEAESSENTMTTHRELMMSPVVINQALRQLPPQYRVDLEGQQPGQWAKTIAANLAVGVTRRTNLLDVTYRSQNPEAAAAIVRSIVDSYLDFVGKTHKGTASDRLNTLLAEGRQVYAQLTAKQQELLRHAEAIGHLGLENNTQFVEPEIQRALKVHESLVQEQEKVLQIRGTLETVNNAIARGDNINRYLMGVEPTVGRQMLLAALGVSNEDLRMLTEQQKKLFDAQNDLNRLSAYLLPNHPQIIDLQSRIATLEQYVRSYRTSTGQNFSNLDNAQLGAMIRPILEQSLNQAIQNERQLAASFEQARQQATSRSSALLKLHMLEDEVGFLKARYMGLQERTSAIDEKQEQLPIQVTVVREPLPELVPVSPKLRLIGLASVLGGLVLGSLIVYVQDLLDDRFNSPEEMSAQLNVPILAMVRKLEPLPGEGLETVYTHALPSSVETEAFRTLRTAISLGAEACERILISSSEPGDGKTTVSANLAVAFAQAGKRTLVIDADLRRPGFTTLLNLKGQPGVADVLTSQQAPAESAPGLVHHTTEEGLDVLPVGLRRPNPAELLSSPAFVELLAWAESQYDRVLVDCPPVLAVSDAQIVGPLVDGAILVVQPEKNHRRSVIRAVDSFRATGCNVLGVVANGISHSAAGYGYGYGLGYGYGDGYGEEVSPHEEKAPQAPPQPASLRVTDHRPASPTRIGEDRNANRTLPIRPRRAA